MPYYHVKDFIHGLDTRRMVETTEAGSLIQGLNCVISRGGEVERRKAWNVLFTLPVGTFGLYSEDRFAGLYHVWGTIADPGMPSNVIYHQVEHPTGSAMISVECVRYFMKNFYVVAEFENGDFINFYNDIVVVADPYPEGDAAEGITNPNPNPYPVGGDRATATMRINRIEEGSTGNITRIYALRTSATNILEVEVFDCFVGTIAIDATETDETIAARVAAEINNYALGSREFHAKSDGDRIWISFELTGTRYNGYSVVFVQDVVAAINLRPKPPVFFGGVDTLASVADFSTRAAQTEYAPGRFVLQHRDKMYAVTGAAGMLRCSMTREPRTWAFGYTGVDHWDLSQEGGRGQSSLSSLAVFDGRLAVFASKSVYIYHMEAESAASQLITTVESTGTISPKTVVEFGNTDVFYLDKTGIRSLKARDLNGAAFASDVGTPIDDLVRQAYDDADFFILRADAVIDPLDGRYVMAIWDDYKKITNWFVFSFFTSTKIAAWTKWETDFYVDNLIVDSQRMYCRDSTNIYVYGSHGAFNIDNDYDDCEAVVQVPYLHAGKPATEKNFYGFDVACENEWVVEMGLDYTDPDLLELIGTVGETTYRQQAVAVQGYGTHVSYKLTCTKAGPAKIGSMAFHYTMGEEPG